MNTIGFMRINVFICMFFMAFRSMAQGIEPEQWMKRIDDEVLVASMSIPGAHDAATGEGMYSPSGLGITQELTLQELWDCGVRAFDLRPAVKDTLLYIYHGPLRTRVSFREALDILCMRLENCPSEFAIVLLREEIDSENERERALWPSLVGKTISSLGDRAAVFSPGMRVADARGKILFLTRSMFSDSDKGACIYGWSHSADGSVDASIVSYATGADARLQVQDYYALTNFEKRMTKLAVVRHFMKLSEEAPEGVWTINFLSGYYNTWLGFSPFATSSGYKRNAAWLHPQVLSMIGSDKCSMGMVFMDYAGVDAVYGAPLGIKHYAVFGKALVRKIIESNF